MNVEAQKQTVITVKQEDDDTAISASLIRTDISSSSVEDDVSSNVKQSSRFPYSSP